MKIKELIKKNLFILYGFIRCNEYSRKIKHKRCIEGNYWTLRCIAEYSVESYRAIKKYIEDNNVERLCKKKSINIGFVVYTSSTWNVDQLFKLFSANEHVNAEIIVAHRSVKQKFTNKEFDETFEFFKKNGYRPIRANQIRDINYYDILFYLDPCELLEKVDFFKLPLNIMVLHTSYSFMLAGNTEKIGIWMYHLAFRYYTDSLYYKKQVEAHKYNTGNAKFYGFPKMDQYYIADCVKHTNKKVIIYAPHHSVDYKKFRASTFKENYKVFLELAAKYSENTYWIYKPHPRLREGSVNAGIFSNTDEYDAYVEKWASLSNASVVIHGDYYPSFKESDCMITDSVSFLAEYQFSHKPLLLLQSGVEEYNHFGKAIVDILYKCAGDDVGYIEKFITDCVNGEDEMFDVRKRFFDKNLDYLKNGINANQRIYYEILKITNKL